MRKIPGKCCFFIVFTAIVVTFSPSASLALNRENITYVTIIPAQIITDSLEAVKVKQCPNRNEPVSGGKPGLRVSHYDLHVVFDTLALVTLPGLKMPVFPIRGKVVIHCKPGSAQPAVPLTPAGERETNINHSSVTGTGIRTKNAKESGRNKRIEINAGPQIEVDSVFIGPIPVTFRRKGSQIHVKVPDDFRVNSDKGMSVTLHYRARLQAARKPPWEDGVVVSADSAGRPWIGMTCQTSGASLWWPCLDRLSEEPDSVRLVFDLPAGSPQLVTNGRNFAPEPLSGNRTRYRALVSYPINLYNITFNIGHYTRFELPYRDVNGQSRNLEFRMLSTGVQQATDHFREAQSMLQGYEQLFGPFAFWNDGYRVVETPYWGMEHQSCVAYGNHLKRNAYHFDFILVHESAHEWWGNSVSACRPHDLWIHEGLATWAEARLLEWRHPDSTVHLQYLDGLRSRIRNRQSVAAPPGTHKRKLDTDIYYKAAWMWHSLRHSVPRVTMFDSLLRQFYHHYSYKTLDTRRLVDDWCRQIGDDYTGFFRHYLYRRRLPILEYRTGKGREDSAEYLELRYRRVSADFCLPLNLGLGMRVSVGRRWTKTKIWDGAEYHITQLEAFHLIELKSKGK